METRFSWVYRKSGLAMLITSLTTCSAFLCCFGTPLPDTQAFGIFAAAVIAADYVFVMTMFCTAGLFCCRARSLLLLGWVSLAVGLGPFCVSVSLRRDRDHVLHRSHGLPQSLREEWNVQLQRAHAYGQLQVCLLSGELRL